LTEYEKRWATCTCPSAIRDIIKPDGSIGLHDHFAAMIDENERLCCDYLLTPARAEVRTIVSLDPAVAQDYAAFTWVDEIRAPAPLPESLRGDLMQGLTDPFYIIREILLLKPGSHTNADIVAAHHGLMSIAPTDTRFVMDATSNSALVEMIERDGYSVLGVIWTGSPTQTGEMGTTGRFYHVGKPVMANGFDALLWNQRIRVDKGRCSPEGQIEFRKELGIYQGKMNAAGHVKYGSIPGTNNHDDVIAALQLGIHMLRNGSNRVSVQYFGEGGKGPGSLFWDASAPVR